jgi:dTDP-4-amino-4,6-dideoxygalactose transaminase
MTKMVESNGRFGVALADRVVLPSDQNASGRSLGTREIELVSEAIRSGTLTPTKGSFVKAFEYAFTERLGVTHVFACTSGTAAMHCAVAAVDPEPGSEIVTTPITDMGALAPLLFQGAIPVFADVDPKTYNVDAGAIRDRLSDRTAAIVATPLFGNPAGTRAIRDLATEVGVPMIEDCSQAYGAQDHGRSVGTFGDIAFFSLQQGKHITTGEGGVIVTDDDTLARRIRLFINKAWDYGGASPDHEFLAMNYRMSELQGAVALAQLDGLDRSVAVRIENADRLTAAIDSVPGIGAPYVTPDTVHSYWRYAVSVDPQVVPGGPDAMAAALGELGVAAAPRYIKKPAYACAVFRDQRTFGTSRYPFTLARPEAVDYSEARFPGTIEALSRVLVLPWNEGYESRHVDEIGRRIAAAAASLEDVT